LTAETACEFLFKKVVCSFDVPEVVVSDRGSNFKAEYTHAYFNRMGARWKHSTSQRPQSNDIVERMNQTLAGIIGKMMLDNELLQWDQCLDEACMVARGMVNLNNWIFAYEAHDRSRNDHTSTMATTRRRMD
jgi:transposase InsO family protein